MPAGDSTGEPSGSALPWVAGPGSPGDTSAGALARLPQLLQQHAPAHGVAVAELHHFAFGFAERIIAEAYRITEMAFWKPDPEDRSRIVRAKVNEHVNPKTVPEVTPDKKRGRLGRAVLTAGVRTLVRLHLVLRSANETRLFTAVTETRPDVAKATQQPGWELSGFQFVARREELPVGEFHIGFLIEGPDGPEFTLTAHRVNLVGAGQALLASGD